MSFFRYDLTAQNNQGIAISGALIYVCNQPVTTSLAPLALPPAPLAVLYAAPISNSANILSASWSGGFIAFGFDAVPADVVVGSFIAVTTAIPTTFNAVWFVASVDGNTVTVASPSNPGAYSSGGVVATSALPNPFPTDGNGNGFFYVPTDTYTVIEHDPFGRIPDKVTPDQVVLAPGGGSVTSVAFTMPSDYLVAGSPITSSGEIDVTYGTQSANYIFAGPTSGSPAAPFFRTLVSADFPAGVGTVTSVDLSVTVPSFQTAAVTNDPITTFGTINLAITANTQSANTVLAGPTSGSLGAQAFRALVSADLPASPTLSGNVGVQGHLNAGPAANTDFAGTITIPPASTSQSFTFASAFNSAPAVVVTPTSSPSAAGIGTYWVTSSTTGFTVSCDSPTPASPPSSFTFNYTVVGNPN